MGVYGPVHKLPCDPKRYALFVILHRKSIGFFVYAWSLKKWISVITVSENIMVDWNCYTLLFAVGFFLFLFLLFLFWFCFVICFIWGVHFLLYFWGGLYCFNFLSFTLYCFFVFLLLFLLLQWNLCNPTPEFSDIPWHPTKNYGPKVVLLT